MLLNEHNHLSANFKKKEDIVGDAMAGLLGRLNYFNTNSIYSTEKMKKLTNDPDKGNSNLALEDTAEKFKLSNYLMPFLPGFLRIEIIIMYGCNEIQKTFTRFFVLNNDIQMNERINFDELLV